MNKENKSWGYWTVENVLEESKKYSSKTEFREGNGSAYNVAKRKKLLDQMTWLKPRKKPAGYWTKDHVV